MASKPVFEGLPDGWLPSGDPHVPGRTARPDGDDEVHRIAGAAPDPTDPASWHSNPAWRAGLVLYAHGYFWEAHEVWEAVWMNCRPNSRARALLQAVIQLANAALKQKMGRPQASRRLAALAASHLADAGQQGRLMGLDLAALRDGINAYSHALETDDAASAPLLNAYDRSASSR